ncbi:MAG TPA: PEGA domain-containing protein [Methanoregula sp.]|nr:PEGA domain-containing protein [Methanoregula sp.]
MKRIFVILAIILCVVVSGCTSVQVPAGKGTLQFQTSPEGAQIYLDNEYKGTTPGTVSGVSTGSHSLEFRYSGYQNWKAAITVPAGSSSYYAALTPITASTTTAVTQSPGTTGTQPAVGIDRSLPTINVYVSQETLILGSSQTFYGTCTGSNKVILMIYGPGSYVNGVTIAEPVVNGDNTWSYTWNKGTSLMSGTYTVVAYDSQKLVSDKKVFSVVGGGTVSIVTPNPVVSVGDTASFTGICTTGSKSVTLTLYGPGQFANGMTLATLTLAADQTWSYKYKFDTTKPLGSYTISVHDAQNTASDSVTINLMVSS